RPVISVEQARQQAVEMVESGFARRRVTAPIVEPRSDSALDLLDDVVILVLDDVESAAGAARAARGIEDPRAVDDASAVDGERNDDVDRQTPGVEVQHRVGEQEEVVRGDVSSLEGIFAIARLRNMHA